MNLALAPCKNTTQAPDAHPAIAKSVIAMPPDSRVGEQPEWWLWPFHYGQKDLIARIESGHPQHG